MSDYTAIHAAALRVIKQAQAVEQAATQGPWYAGFTDDTSYMCATLITTVPRDVPHDNERGMGDDNDCNTVVASTLLQSPRLICHAAERWYADAILIATMRNALAGNLAAQAEQVEYEYQHLRIGQCAYDAIHAARLLVACRALQCYDVPGRDELQNLLAEVR